LKTADASVLNVAISAASLACSSHTGGGQVWDVFGEGVLGSNTAGVDRASLAGLGESIVARVEILPLFEVLRKMVGLGREFAVKTEESLLVGREGLAYSQ
jgi:hypothetical protein